MILTGLSVVDLRWTSRGPDLFMITPLEIITVLTNSMSICRRDYSNIFIGSALPSVVFNSRNTNIAGLFQKVSSNLSASACFISFFSRVLFAVERIWIQRRRESKHFCSCPSCNNTNLCWLLVLYVGTFSVDS